MTEQARAAVTRRNAGVFSEKQIFLKTAAGTRFVRLRPRHMLLALLGGTALVGWTLTATAVLVVDLAQGQDARQQALHDQAIYEGRIADLAAERDALREAARQAQEGFDAALSEFAGFQDRLASADGRIREVEQSAAALRRILARTLADRDAAAEKLAALAAQAGAEDVAALRKQRVETEATLAFLSGALARTAAERDARAAEARDAQTALADAEFELAVLEDTNRRIFSQLEEAVTLAMEPLGGMFTEVGLPPERVLREMRQQYSGQGGPLQPVAISASNQDDAMSARANAILAHMDDLNLYRIAADRVPFALPVSANVRRTSGFGYRRDPIRGGTRLHAGMDWAGAYGTPIVASAEGVVTFAGWQSGYGRLVKIAHDFGIETRFAHLAKIDVKVGQRVSRGDRIGGMGSSGRSTGTHLHYEVRVGGEPVNPMTFIRAAQDVF